MYRGVTRHHQHGRWQARIGRVAGNKDLYLGTYSEWQFDLGVCRGGGGLYVLLGCGGRCAVAADVGI